jgi:hypothetical protein
MSAVSFATSSAGRCATNVRLPSKARVAEIFAWETAPGFALHIVNYNNPNLHRGYIRKHYPIGAQTVRFELPAGAKISRANLLRAEASLPFRQQANVVEFVIPRVLDYEVAALEL